MTFLSFLFFSEKIAIQNKFCLAVSFSYTKDKTRQGYKKNGIQGVRDRFVMERGPMILINVSWRIQATSLHKVSDEKVKN